MRRVLLVMMRVPEDGLSVLRCGCGLVMERGQ